MGILGLRISHIWGFRHPTASRTFARAKSEKVLKSVRILTLLYCMTLLVLPVRGQQQESRAGLYTVAIQVQNHQTDLPVGFASVLLTRESDGRILSGSCDDQGICRFERVAAGRYKLRVTFLGYKPYTQVIPVDDSFTWLALLEPDAVNLDEVVVTASESRGMTSSSKIDRQAMEHLQPSSFADLVSLLPGESSTTPLMGAANLIRLREAGSGIYTNGTSGNTKYDISSLGTSFLMDGVPISTKGNMQYIAGSGNDSDVADRSTAGRGLDMRTISTDDIEHVEVVRGIPSVEYGDLTSGLIKIERRKGGNKLYARFKADSRSKLFYVGKGLEWEKRKLTLNAGIDFLDSKIDPRIPLENYKRFTASVRLSKGWQLGEGLLTYSSNLDYGGSFDNVKLDPDVNYHNEDTYKANYNRYAWTNNLVWTNNKKRFFRSLELNTSVSLQKDVSERTRYVSLQGPQPTPPLTTEEGVHDGSWLTPSYIATGGTESLPFSAFAKLVARFSAHGDKAQHDMVVGSDWQMNKNYGQGQIYDPLFPIYPGVTTRPRTYYDITAGHDFSLFVEDRSIMPVSRHKLEVQAGVRATTMLNLSDSYDLHGKFFFDPRVNLRWSFPRLMLAGYPLQFEIGGGVGWHTMTPPMTSLYPDMLYYDLQQLNYYHSDPNYRRLNLKTYVIDPTNYDLQAARNFKWEVRADISYGENRFTVTYFREDMKSGFRSESQYQVMNYRKYDATGLDPNTLTSPPQLENLPYMDMTVFGTYSVPSNGTRIFKEGVEYQFVSKRIPALYTRITVDGAWFHTLYSDSKPYWYRPSVNLGGQQVPYLGYYHDPSGYWKRSLNTRFMFDTYLPRLKLGFSAAVECLWFSYIRSLRQTGIPDEYIGLDEVRHSFNVEEARNDMYLQWLIIAYPESNFAERVSTPLNVGVNLKVTKKFYKERIELAFFVNQLFSHYRSYTLNGIVSQRIGDMPYFGMEINFSL